MIIIYSPSAQLAAITLELDTPPALTLGAEYGGFVCEGTKYTSAWNQPVVSKYAGALVSCLDQNIPTAEENDVVLISHISANILGGLMRAKGESLEEFSKFFSKVGLAERTGIHKLIEDDDYRLILGIEALISEEEEILTHEHNSDVTEICESLIEKMKEALTTNSGEAWERGVKEADHIRDLNISSLVTMTKMGLIVRKSEHSYMDNLFSDPDGNEGVALISYRDDIGRVTISLADEIYGLSCKEIAEELWGESERGNHMKSSSPHGLRISEENFFHSVEYFMDRLVGVLYG